MGNTLSCNIQTGSINWDMISAIIDVLNFIAIFVPAIIIFIFYKINKLDLIIADISKSQVQIIVHNKSPKAIFLRKIYLIYKKNKQEKKLELPFSNNNHYICIKSDAIYNLDIDLNLYDITENAQLCIKVIHNGIFTYSKKIKREKD